MNETVANQPVEGALLVVTVVFLAVAAILLMSIFFNFNADSDSKTDPAGNDTHHTESDSALDFMLADSMHSHYDVKDGFDAGAHDTGENAHNRSND